MSPKQKLRLLYAVGLLLSAYATYVELRAEADANYVALCDLRPKISCTAVFNTKYGKGFGLVALLSGPQSLWNQPNGILGCSFYLLQLLLSVFAANCAAVWLLLGCSLLANGVSAYLAYLLYFVLEDLCIVCVAIYVVNCVALLQVWRLFKARQRDDDVAPTVVASPAGELKKSD